MSAERTEKATPKRRNEARSKGQAPRSTEVGNLFLLVAGFVVISLTAPKMLERFESSTELAFRGLASPHLEGDKLGTALNAVMTTVIGLTLPVFAVTAAAGVAASVLQVKPRFTPDGVKPDLKRLNPLPGAKRLVSPHSLVDLVKSLIKLAAIGGMAALTIYPKVDQLLQFGNLSPLVSMRIVGGLVTTLVWRVVGVLIVVALADVLWTRWKFEKDLKMSKEDIKQEAKNQDLPPEVRGKIRQKQREAHRARMLGDVQHADVVITNPTHFAVALAYRPEDGAPRVLAKGADLLAFKIRELAKEHRVQIVENPPLARQLYAEVEVGQHIPAAAFAAVAEVLAFVYRRNRVRKYAWA